MPNPRSIRLGLKIKLLGRSYTAHSLDTGVPHAVVEVKDLDLFPVFEAGRALRRHPKFKPAGTNADFISISSGKIKMRTYERGVEDETLACGTGAIASALVCFILGQCSSPVTVEVRSKDKLKVSFKPEGPQSFKDVWLEGPARIVFSGELSL